MKEVVDRLTVNMHESGMNSGEIWDELKSMHIGLADAFEQQYDFDVQKWREEKERLAELDRKAEGKAEGKDAVDLSLGWNPLLILTAIAGFIVGFFQGFFGEASKLLGILMKPFKLGWTKLSKLIGESTIVQWFKSIKAWMGKKLTLGWKAAKLLVKNSTIVQWMGKVVGWFNAVVKFGASVDGIETIVKGSPSGSST